MTIQRSKDYYRTVNGQRILVHGHNYEHEAEEPSSEDFDAAFEEEFGGAHAAAPAAASEPEEPSTEDFDAAFDQEFGGAPAAEPKVEEKPKLSPFEMGKAAFHAGKSGAPIENKEFWDQHVEGKVGTPKGKKAMEEYSKGWMEANLAAPVPDEPEAKPETAGPKPGDPVGFDAIKEGMVLEGSTKGAHFLVVAKTPDTVFVQNVDGLLTSNTEDQITSSAQKGKVLHLVASTGEAFKMNTIVDLQVGDTKVESGKTFVFNKNHRWELQEDPQAARGPKPGDPLTNVEIKPGMTIQGGVSKKLALVIGEENGIVFVQTKAGNLFGFSKGAVHDNWLFSSSDDSGYEFVESSDSPQVGNTKTFDGKTYVFNRNHRWELQGEAQAAPAAAPAAPAGTFAGKVTGLQPGGMGNDASGIVTDKGVKVFRSKLNNGAYLFVSKHFHGGDSLGESLPLKLKHAIVAIPGASIKATHMHGAMKYLEVPFEQAEALEKVLGDFESGTLVAPKKEPAQAYEPGAHVPFKDLKPGMKFAYAGTSHEYEVVQKNPQSVVLKMVNKRTGEASSYQPKVTAKHWTAGYEPQLALKGGGGENQPEHHVGETKVEHGKTYILNENHKWELAPGQEPPAKAKKASFKPTDDKFPYKKVGPQAGAQPGGVFEDEFGQKWYIKFPPSEDVCKNEVLALKLYESILGKGSVPSVKMVKARGISDVAPDGKLGIASKWVDGLKEDHNALATGKVPNAWEGFALDAWMANWDVVGGNQSQWKNMVVGPDGKAVRVDAGGALLYKGLGGAKGHEFSDEVNEIERLRNPSVNHETAHVYKGITKDQIVQSVTKVLEVPDDFIQAMVDKFGPGDEAAKAALAQKLIARKQSLAKQFPEADLIAHPPPPDKRHLKVDPSKLPAMLDYFKMGGQGPTKTWVSATEAINKYNNQAAQDLYDLAMKGDYIALKDYKAPDINKATGEIVGYVPVPEHKSSKYLVPFYDSIMEHLEVLAYPASAHAKKWTIPTDVDDIASLSAAFPGHEFGVTVADVPANERLGFWIQLGQVQDPARFMPPKTHNVTGAQKEAGTTDYDKFSSKLKNWLGNVQGSGSANVGDKKGHVEQYAPVIADAYQKATEFEAGTMLRRWMHMPSDMKKQLVEAEPGIVFENPRSQCCSMNPSWEKQGTHFGDVMFEMVYAEGAKGLATYASGHFGSEQEITSLPGQRYMLIEKGKTSNGSPKYTLLVLPPDPTYIDALNGQKVA